MRSFLGTSFVIATINSKPFNKRIATIPVSRTRQLFVGAVFLALTIGSGRPRPFFLLPNTVSVLENRSYLCGEVFRLLFPPLSILQQAHKLYQAFASFLRTPITLTRCSLLFTSHSTQSLSLERYPNPQARQQDSILSLVVFLLSVLPLPLKRSFVKSSLKPSAAKPAPTSSANPCPCRRASGSFA